MVEERASDALPCSRYGEHRFSPEGRCSCGYRDYSNLKQYTIAQLVTDVNALSDKNRKLQRSLDAVQPELRHLRRVNKIQYALITTAIAEALVALAKIFFFRMGH